MADERPLSTFSVRVRSVGGIVRVQLTGELDVATAPRLATVFSRIRRASRRPVELALDQLEFCDLSGMRVLLGAALPAGGGWSLAGAHGSVRRILDATGYGDLIQPSDGSADGAPHHPVPPARAIASTREQAEGRQQAAVRRQNERTERANRATGPQEPVSLRCECGDLGCVDRVSLAHEQYEAVRARGSRFLVKTNHENPETSMVVCESERFGVIEVLTEEARSLALRSDPRRPEQA
jgi:anti-sigma B factor antagonist